MVSAFERKYVRKQFRANLLKLKERKPVEKVMRDHFGFLDFENSLMKNSCLRIHHMQNSMMKSLHIAKDTPLPKNTPPF